MILTRLIYQHGCINVQVRFKLSGQIMEERPEPTSSQSFLYAQNFLNHSADSKLVKTYWCLELSDWLMAWCDGTASEFQNTVRQQCKGVEQRPPKQCCPVKNIFSSGSALVRNRRNEHISSSCKLRCIQTALKKFSCKTWPHMVTSTKEFLSFQSEHEASWKSRWIIPLYQGWPKTSMTPKFQNWIQCMVSTW